MTGRDAGRHRRHPLAGIAGRGLVRKIVSGGQTGIDRGALDAATRLGIPHGGWCPKGRRAEDGAIPARYQLEETGSTSYADRTQRNVRDSDGTVILCPNPDRLSGGTALTLRWAERLSKPCRVVSLEVEPCVEELRTWLVDQGIGVLNVAGPRESEYPGGQQKAALFLARLLAIRKGV